MNHRRVDHWLPQRDPGRKRKAQGNMFRETFPELSDVSIFFPTRVLSIFNRAEISKNDLLRRDGSEIMDLRLEHIRQFLQFLKIYAV